MTKYKKLVRCVGVELKRLLNLFSKGDDVSWVELALDYLQNYFPRSYYVRILLMVALSSFLPGVGFLYVRLMSVRMLNVDKLPSYVSFEMICVWIFLVTFLYMFLIDYSSKRIKKIFANIAFIDYEKDALEDFLKNSIKRMFRPPTWFFILVVVVFTPVEYYLLNLSQICAGNMVTTFLIVSILVYINFLNWIGIWFLFMFFNTSASFGKEIPLKVAPFHPDRLGGFSPIAEISTLAIMNVGSISVLVTTLWYFVSYHLSIVFALFTSLVIPIAFFASMHGVYTKLVNEKKVLLDNILDDFIYTTERIESFIKSKEKDSVEIQEFNVLTQTLSSLDIIYNKINSMRTFPFNYNILIKVVSSALLPRIITMILDYSGFSIVT